MNAIRKGFNNAVSALIMVATLAVPAAIMTVEANAALDPSIATAMTGLQADATSLLALVFPVVLSIFAMLTGIKLFKRFGNKV